MITSLLHRLARLVTTYPRTIVLCALLVTAGSAWLSATRLQMNTNQDDLISESLPYHRQYKDYLRNFGDQEYLYVVVDAQRDPAQARQFTQALAMRLRALPALDNVVATIDATPLLRNALLYLDTPALQSTLQLLAQPALQPDALVRWNTLAHLWGGVEHLLAQPIDASARDTLAPAFTLLNNLLGDLQSTITSAAPVPPLWDRLAGGAGQGIDGQGFITAGGGKYLFLFIMPHKDYETLAVIEQPLQAVRAALDQTRREFPDIAAGLTGRPVLAADEMAITNRDMTIATIASMALIFGLFWYALRRLREPLLVLGVLSLGMSWSYGFAALTIGSLNLLSVVFSVILVAGVEFGVHIVTHYREERSHGATPRDAMVRSITDAGRGVITTALTTSLALYCACFTDFQALRELGWISGTGTLLCLLGMLTALPAALVWWDTIASARSSFQQKLESIFPRRQWIPAFAGMTKSPTLSSLTVSHLTLKPLTPCFARPRAVIVASILLVLAAAACIPRVFFDHNLLNLQADGLESVEYERLITDATGTSTWQAVVRVPSIDAARSVSAHMRTLPSVGSVESIADLVPTEADTKRALLATSGLRVTPDAQWQSATSVDLPQLSTTFAAMATRIDELASLALTNGTADDAAALGTLADRIAAIRQQLRAITPDGLTRLLAYQTSVMHDVHQLLGTALQSLQPTAFTLNDLPSVLRSRFVSTTGDFAVYITPRGDIWDPAAMATFVTELRSIAPEVTGVPIEVYESSRLLERSFRDVAVYSILAIFLLVWSDFRNLRDTFLSMVPLVFGLVLLAGLMGLFKIPLNLANFFALPIIIGIAIDNGVQIIHRVRNSTDSITQIMLGSTGTGALIASLTGFLTFITLCGASHRGIRSLGLLITLGVATCTLGAVLLLPALLARRAPPRREELNIAVGALDR